MLFINANLFVAVFKFDAGIVINSFIYLQYSKLTKYLLMQSLPFLFPKDRNGLKKSSYLPHTALGM